MVCSPKVEAARAVRTKTVCALIRMTHTDSDVFRAYSILGLPVNASQNDVKEKFKALVLQVRSLFLYTTSQFSSRLTKVSTEKLA